jgi:DNA-directed RNA polymerase subunit beta'
MGKVDYLRGFKENVIMGHIIPAGTGYTLHRRVELKPLAEPIPAEEPPEVMSLTTEPLAG